MLTSRNGSIWTTIAVAVLLMLIAGGPAEAQAGEGNFELYLGYYFPDDTDVGEDLTYGVRAGYRFADAFGLQGTLGRFETDVFSINVELILADLSFMWFTNPGSHAEFFVYGGPGWAFVKADAFGLQVSEDSLTAHVGLGVMIPIGDKLYLRPDARARWFEQGDNETDLEATLALGFRFGK